jgi:predicted DNA-binding transcriptional regulator AlpA
MDTFKTLSERDRIRPPRRARPAPDGQELLIADEAAHLLGVARSTLWLMAKRPDFPPRVRLTATRGGWLRSDLMAWLQSRRVQRGAA